MCVCVCRQKYWSGLPCPHPWDEPRSSALQADSLHSDPPGKCGPVVVLKGASLKGERELLT